MSPNCSALLEIEEEKIQRRPGEDVSEIRVM